VAAPSGGREVPPRAAAPLPGRRPDLCDLMRRHAGGPQQEPVDDIDALVQQSTTPHFRGAGGGLHLAGTAKSSSRDRGVPEQGGPSS